MSGYPARRDDIVAGTEFLSVFINGAMAHPPVRRRGSRRGSLGDHVASESQRQEASIYRISRTSRTTSARPTLDPTAKETMSTSPREEGVRFYPISQKSFDNSASLASLIDDLSTASEIDSMLTPRTNVLSQKVIGVSVTSTVEATPYKVRVEHYVGDEMTTAARPKSTSTTPAPTSTTPVSFVTPVTEELSNIVSESNSSGFLIDEGFPRTCNWRYRGRVAPQKGIQETWRSHGFNRQIEKHNRKDENRDMENETPEGNFQVSERNEEQTETTIRHGHQGRKAGRHFENVLYAPPGPSNYPAQQSKHNQDNSRPFSQPTKLYSEPSRVYSEPAKVYSEPARVYGEPEKVYSEPAKVYSEPARVYSEPSKFYSEPARVYSEPARVYGMDGRPVKTSKDAEEPEEENYEIDEAVSVGSNGNVHGPQAVTESSGSNAQESDDGHKVGYVVEGRNYRKYRVEERTPDGFIVGEYGVVSHDDGSLRGVRYTADGNINPRLIHDTLMKFLAL